MDSDIQPPVVDRDDVHWMKTCLLPLLTDADKLWPNAEARVKNVEINQLSLTESFMLTICYKIRVTLSTNGQDDKIVHLVVKMTPAIDEELYRLTCFTELFHNEVTAYKVIFPALGWSDDYPKYYYSHSRPLSAAIVLSDFTVDGWRMSHSKVNLSLDHIQVAVAELGKLHGTMYGLKHTDGARFASICSQLCESRFVLDGTSEQWDRRLRIGPQRATAAVRAHDKLHGTVTVPEWFLQRLESLLAETFRYQKRVALRRVEPLAILCHGDFLRNNIAFKYGGPTGDVAERALLFDFQTLRYASPMYDLTTFMVNSTGAAVRQPHFAGIFGAYHTSLCQHFASVTGIPMTSVDFPEHLGADNMLREYALYLPFGLSIGASFLPVLHVPDETPFVEYALRTVEADVADAWARGGDILDAELRAIVTDMFALYERFQLQLSDEF